MVKPAISVIMPNYNNNEEYLREAIESVLSQTFEDFEFIIVDDGSQGDDVKIIESYKDSRIVLVKAKHSGLVKTLNKGLSHARGTYFARFDSDDICFENRLEKQYEFMNSHPEIAIAGSRMVGFGDSTRHFAAFISNSEDHACAMFFGCQLYHPSVMMRASFLSKNNIKYDETFQHAEDYDLWSRCILKGKIAEMPDILVKYRCHSKQISTIQNSGQIEYTNKVRRNLLSKILLIPGEEQMRAHVALCTGQPDDTLPLQTISNWAETLIDANSRRKLFNVKYFERRIMCHYAVLLAKYFKRGESISGSPMTKKAFSPRWLGAYAVRAALPLRLK